MLILLDEYREARLWSEKAMELFPDNPDLLAAKAQAVSRMGQLKRAIALSDFSVEKQGNSAHVWSCRGDVMLAAKSRVASYCLEKAIQLAGRDVLAIVAAARVYRYHGRLLKARECYRRAVECCPESPGAWYELGRCEVELGLVGEAEKSLTRALELRADFTSAKHYLDRLDDRGAGMRIKGFFRRLFGR